MRHRQSFFEQVNYSNSTDAIDQKDKINILNICRIRFREKVLTINKSPCKKGLRRQINEKEKSIIFLFPV